MDFFDKNHTFCGNLIPGGLDAAEEAPESRGNFFGGLQLLAAGYCCDFGL